MLRAGVPQVDLAILYSDYAYQLPKRNFAPGEPLATCGSSNTRDGSGET